MTASAGRFDSDRESFTEPGDDSRPQQFKAVEAWLHEQRDRTRELTLNWRPSHSLDVRDLRSPELLGETLLRMQVTLPNSVTSPGSLSQRQDALELRP